MEPKRLYRSRENRVLCGVCGGIAEYFNVDPVLIRLGMVLFICASVGTGLLAYFIASVIMPDQIFGAILLEKEGDALNMKQKKITREEIPSMEEKDRMKYEIAEELGLLDQVLEEGWKSLSSKETERIGGLMTRRRRKSAEDPA